MSRLFRLLCLCLGLATLPGCLKNNGEPYPGAQSDQTNGGDNGGGDTTGVNPNSPIYIDEELSCSTDDSANPRLVVFMQAENGNKAIIDSALYVSTTSSPDTTATNGTVTAAAESNFVTYTGSNFSVQISREQQDDGFFSATFSYGGSARTATCTSTGFANDRK